MDAVQSGLMVIIEKLIKLPTVPIVRSLLQLMGFVKLFFLLIWFCWSKLIHLHIYQLAKTATR